MNELYAKACELIVEEKIMPEIVLNDGTIVVGYAIEEDKIICEDPDTGKTILVEIKDVKQVIG